MKEQETRAYIFGNMYLSSIQQGIQAAHVITNMFAEYKNRSKRKNMLYRWASKDKTIVLLNGGRSTDLRHLATFFDDNRKNPYPWSEFFEDEDSLDGALTSVGIILPERIYEGAKCIREGGELTDSGFILVYINDEANWIRYSWWEKSLMEIINKCSLAI